jgi:hypothetical protein
VFIATLAVAAYAVSLLNKGVEVNIIVFNRLVCVLGTAIALLGVSGLAAQAETASSAALLLEPTATENTAIAQVSETSLEAAPASTTSQPMVSEPNETEPNETTAETAPGESIAETSAPAASVDETSTDDTSIDSATSQAAEPETPASATIAPENTTSQTPVSEPTPENQQAIDETPSRTAQADEVAPGRATRSGPSYIGVGGNIGIGDGDTAVGEGSFAVFSKVGLTRYLSVRPTVLFSDDPTILIPVTVDFIPGVTDLTEDVSGELGLRVSPYLGAGIAISTGDDSGVDFLASAGVDVPITGRLTATAAVNATLFDNTAIGLLLGVGYNF